MPLRSKDSILSDLWKWKLNVARLPLVFKEKQKVDNKLMVNKKKRQGREKLRVWA